MKRSVAVLAVLAVFVVGVIAGILGTHLFYVYKLRQPGGLASAGLHAYARQLDRKLDLNDTQRRQVDAILDDARRDAVALRRDIEPRATELVEHAMDRIDGVLEPEQKERFEELRRRLRQRMERFTVDR